jgi:hypothetical protein
MGAKRNILALHRRIAKDTAKTIEANSKGGRYYKATAAEKLKAAAVAPRHLIDPRG